MKRLVIGFLVFLFTAGVALAANPMVEMETSSGKIVIELYPDKAPKSVENFLQYAKDGFYNGTIFHRVIAGFMIQGGGFTDKMVQKPTRAPVQNEAANGLKNDRGTLAMARTNDPHSATAQFYINHKDNASLNYRGPGNFGYAVFGRVTQGMEVVDAIAKVPTGRAGPFTDVPRQPVVIQSVKVISDK